ncbi:helix-turn-helix domain-containing protein [Lolliginicoccus levis]|uniref:helix-turn-helix domain-containing protein n=1 Tax=Lolliginicoccus levis TaxID=2919542 RepID=UPI00241E0B3E|nr:helix-turn-helix transcriptional regulator [Lolliginicoccus levis]
MWSIHLAPDALAWLRGLPPADQAAITALLDDLPATGPPAPPRLLRARAPSGDHHLRCSIDGSDILVHGDLAPDRDGALPWPRARDQLATARDEPARRAHDDALRRARLDRALAALARDARAGAGLSQAALAAACGTTQSAIAAIESGARVPGLDMLDRIARATGHRLALGLAPATGDDTMTPATRTRDG